jgi:hypothetical protein
LGRPNQQSLGALARINPEAAMKVQKYFDSLDESGRKREESKWKAAGPVLMRLKTIPPEQRAAFAQAALPQLQAAGWTPEELANVDLSDQSIDALATTAMTVDQVLDSQKLRWNPIGENGSFATDHLGNPVGEGNPFAPQARKGPPQQTESLGGIIESHATNYGGIGSLPRGGSVDLNAASALGAGFGRVTSTTRTPEHNKRVGGVRNSHHLKGRAIDIARQPGVSHAQIEQAYKSAGYKIVESIDEGDHSHFAFSGSPPPGAKGRILAEANAAIAKGADPAAVKERLRKMGIIR